MLGTVKKIFDGIELAFILIIALPFVIVVLIVYLVSLPFTYIRNQKFKKEYSQYLQQIEGYNIFCYNNRNKGRGYIEDFVLPNLNEGIEVLFLNGRVIDSKKFDNSFIPYALYNLKKYSRFPHLLKVRNGEVIDHSVNRLMFDCKNQGKDISLLFEDINSFFELESNMNNI